MTIISLVRHAQPDYSVHDDYTRPLTEKGKEGALAVRDLLQKESITAIYTSPYLWAADTVRPLAEALGLPLMEESAFRERKVSGGDWISDLDFAVFTQRQWSDRNYKLPGGESLREVETRVVKGLVAVLARHANEHVAIGTHGTALAVLMHHYDVAFGIEQFLALVKKMPWVVQYTFEGARCRARRQLDPISPAFL